MKNLLKLSDPKLWATNTEFPVATPFSIAHIILINIIDIPIAPTPTVLTLLTIAIEISPAAICNTFSAVIGIIKDSIFFFIISSSTADALIINTSICYTYSITLRKIY